MDRASRFVVAHGSGAHDVPLLAAVVHHAVGRMGGRACHWCGDGLHEYGNVLRREYRRPVYTGKPGRPRLLLPAGLALTQTIKHRDGSGQVIDIEHRATIGDLVPRPGTVHIERLNGSLRDRLACLTRATHAFAKTRHTWQAIVGLALFAHNWLWPHAALRQPSAEPDRRYTRRTPAMALGLTDRCWSWEQILTTPKPVSR